MLFSVFYWSKHRGAADEIRCPYNQLGQTLKFFQKYPEKRLNIIVEEENPNKEKIIEQVNLIKEIVKDYTISCKSLSLLLQLLNEGYKGYLAYPVTDWETFANLKKHQVSDIYIDGPLGFQMNLLQKAKGDIKVRVSPTISYNTTIAANREVNSFFIRPEDLQFYASIDVIDFNKIDQEKEDALFSIYKRGTFNFEINNLIEGLPAYSNLIFKEDFGKQRANCGQRCNIPGHKCHYCEHYFNIINLLNQITKYN